MASTEQSTHRLSVHGLGAIIRNRIGRLVPAIQRALGEFVVDELAENIGLADGMIREYEQTEVMRHLSPTAVAISDSRETIELYQDGERFWLIDDRWGLCEINVLKNQWRSWILAEPAVDATRIVEMAMLWPLAQLLRGKGLYLIPTAAVARQDMGVLIVSPFGIEQELSFLVKSGFRIVGQRWVALRDEEKQVRMLHMPGWVERFPTPRLRSIGSETGGMSVDLESEYCGSGLASATCTSVLLIEPGRRPTPYLRNIAPSSALPCLRRAWPITELHPHRTSGQLPTKLSRRCKVYGVRLSQRPQDLLDLLDSARNIELAQRAEAAAIRETVKLLDRQLEQQPRIAI